MNLIALRAGVIWLFLVGLLPLTHAAPITVLNGDNGTFHFLDNVSANSFNFPQGLRQTLGAVDVTAGGFAGTTGAYIPAPAPGTTITPQLFVGAPSLSANNFTVSPNLYGRSPDAAIAQDGRWLLGFQNTGGGTTDYAVATTRSIAGATVIDHPGSVSISGSGFNPTFNWTLPSNPTNIDAVRIQVWDHQRSVGVGLAGVGGAGIADVIYVSGKIPTTATSFTLPVDANGFIAPTALPGGGQTAPFQLQINGLYSLEISLLDLRDPNGGVGLPNILSRTRSIFDFTFLPQGAPANVFLPMVNLAGPAPVFSFQPISVQPGQQIFIDPLLAVGYDYQTGQGNPNFRTMLLPTGVGDSMYELYLWQNGQWVKVADVQGGQEYDFGDGGVDRFRILGIETSAGLEPDNPTAFITGLTFVGEGVFSGTMTAITVNVPEPGSLVPVMLGLLFLLRRRAALRPNRRG